MLFRPSIPRKIQRKPDVPPILFVHAAIPSSKPETKLFLDIALRQATLASPANDVILLSDVHRPGVPGITQLRLANYHRDASRFERLYRHTSVNSADYERFCFARWFHIREFVQRHGIERLCVLDSDIMLFSPIERFIVEFDGYQAGNWAWANVLTAAGLELMCGYFEQIFRDGRLLATLADKYRYDGRPHLSDMYALNELAAGNPAFLDQNGLKAKGFDDSIGAPGLFVMDGAFKLLTIGNDGVPIGRRSVDGAEVPFHFLHFQGGAKSLMAKYAWCAPRGRLVMHT